MFRKITSFVCAISVIALGAAEAVCTFAGAELPRPLTYMFWILCIINGLFLVMNAPSAGCADRGLRNTAP